MSFYFNAPIYSLDDDLLWKIFAFTSTPGVHEDPNLAPESAFEDARRSPLTNLRHCSQVCRFWRNIILDSASLWASVIDLGVLWQKEDYWRDEVLRRTKGALLAVTGRCPDVLIEQYVGFRSFFSKLIHDNWTRIQSLDIALHPFNLHDEMVLRALGRPAPNLRLFSIQPFSDPHERGKYMLLDLLDACAQMSHLEHLSVNMWGIIPDDPNDPRASSLGRIMLPRLGMIDIKTQSLAFYSKFLSRIIPHPRCALRVHTDYTMQQTTAETLTENADAMHHVITRYGNNLPTYYANGPLRVTNLGMRMFENMVVFRAWQETYGSSGWELEIMIFHDDGISSIILDSFADAVSSLGYPKSIAFLLEENHTFEIPSFLRLYLALDSITELRTTPKDLAYITSQLPEGTLLFPTLKIIMIVQIWDPNTDKITLIKPFLVNRRHIAPVEFLCLYPPCWPLSDLQVLDELTGLIIYWRSEDEHMEIEYVCGGGNCTNI